MADLIMLKTGWDFGKDFFKVFHSASEQIERMNKASDQVSHLKRGCLRVNTGPTTRNKKMTICHIKFQNN